MVHLLSSFLRSEFLAVPQLVRLDTPLGSGGEAEPTLLVKASSLALKYLVRLGKFRLILSHLENGWLAYGVEIADDPAKPATVWSVIERPEELDALRSLLNNPRCVVFLFNELAVSVAWTEIDIALPHQFAHLLGNVVLHPIDDQTVVDLVSRRLDSLREAGASASDDYLVDFTALNWTEVQAVYITSTAGGSFLSIFGADEGGQQEELAVWLTDSLHPTGCVKSPQVHETGSRELSDVLLSYEQGAFLIESKSLSILARERLPDRQKLASDLKKHIRKAARQLNGAIRSLSRGLRVTDAADRDIEVDRSHPVHAIILVPDLSLLGDAPEFGGAFIREFCRTSGGFLHILDPAELLRVVQAAEMIAQAGNATTTMMAFDFYLLERVKRALTKPTADFAVLFRWV